MVGPDARPRLSMLPALLALGLLLFITWLAAFAAFSQPLWLLDPTLANLAIVLSGTWHPLRGYARSAAERRWIRNAFAQYLPVPVFEDLARHPERLQLNGEVEVAVRGRPKPIEIFALQE